MKRTMIVALILGLLGAIPVAAGAAQTRENNFRAQLSSAEEVPPIVGLPAAATANFKIRNGNIKFTLRGRLLTGPAWGAHIHAGLPGANGGVVIGLCGAPPGGAKFRCSGKSGKIRVVGLITPALATEWGTTIDALHDSMQLGELYVNVHTDAWGSGEIRGQIIPASGAVG